MYVGPLEEGPDPPCIVEAHIAAGVRSIRLSELEGLHVRVLRPIDLNDMDRCRLADWVVSRIGSEYDLAHAWALGRNLLPAAGAAAFAGSPNTMAKSATRFICCSLLAHAFALVGYPILPDQVRVSPNGTADHRNLTPVISSAHRYSRWSARSTTSFEVLTEFERVTDRHRRAGNRDGSASQRRRSHPHS